MVSLSGVGLRASSVQTNTEVVYQKLMKITSQSIRQRLRVRQDNANVLEETT